MASGDTKTEAMLNVLGNGGSGDEFRGCCNTKTQQYILDAIDRVQNVEDEVEELKNNPDVVDIVDTYADLQAYDTQHLTENDIIRVLEDETHSGNSTYYRFTKNPDTWTFIGEISGGGGGGDTVYSTVTTSNSTTGGAVYIGNLDSNQEEQPDPTITDSHYKYFWALPLSNTIRPNNGSVNILGQEAGDSSVSVGSNAICRLGTQVAIGASSINNYSADAGVAMGYNSKCYSGYSVALGSNAQTSRAGEVNVGVGTTGTGYNSTNYRVIGGVHDPVDAHDAATKGYVDAQAGGGAPYGRYELTEADLNWNSSTGDQTQPYDSIALWLMPYGSYYVNNASRASADKIPVYVYSSMQSFDTKYVYFAYDVLPDSQQSNQMTINCYGSGGSGDSNGKQMMRQFSVYPSSGSWTWSTYSIATNEQLNDEIKTGDLYAVPTTSTSGTIGRFYKFNDNGTYRLYICMDYNSGTSEYIWKEVTLT